MNTFKTLLYMGIMHGFFTFYVPFQLGSLDRPMVDAGVFRASAIPFWVAGALVIVWCSADFVRRGRGTPAHADPPRELVINGLYRYVRNPIYLGALMVLLGYVLWFASRMVALYLLWFLLAYQVLIVWIEEPVLKKTFGVAYEAYCLRVPRWIPKFKS
jgi:protein-S-isoprenylcysteine O-methyltransferase Ste14